jgi:hypothetical protein
MRNIHALSRKLEIRFLNTETSKNKIRATQFSLNPDPRPLATNQPAVLAG